MPSLPSSLWFGTALLREGWAERVRIGVANSRIATIERNVAPDPGDERYAIGVPGAGNVHSHAFQRGIAGLTEYRHGADSFWSWRDAMYGFVQRLTPEHVQAIAAQAYAEMLEAGITRVGEFHYVHHAAGGEPYADIAELGSRVCAAAADTGIGLTLLPVLYAHGGIGGQDPTEAQQRFVNSLPSFERLVEASRRAISALHDGVLGIAAHSLRAVTPDELRELIPLAQGGPIHIHIAEQMAEVQQWQQWTGCRPVDWLLDHAEVNEHWCLVHATHVSDVELTRLAASHATVGLCPITEANLGDGVFPAREYLQREGRFGIGTDSNVLIDFAEELRLLEYGQRLLHRERNVLHGAERSTGRALFERALEAAPRVLGRPSGRLAEGYLADIVALSNTHPSMAERSGDAVLDSWIFAGAPAVEAVWSAGRKVVASGRHHARERIAKRYAAALRKLRNG